MKAKIIWILIIFSFILNISAHSVIINHIREQIDENKFSKAFKSLNDWKPQEDHDLFEKYLLTGILYSTLVNSSKSVPEKKVYLDSASVYINKAYKIIEKDFIETAISLKSDIDLLNKDIVEELTNCEIFHWKEPINDYISGKSKEHEKVLGYHLTIRYINFLDWGKEKVLEANNIFLENYIERTYYAVSFIIRKFSNYQSWNEFARELSAILLTIKNIVVLTGNHDLCETYMRNMYIAMQDQALLETDQNYSKELEDFAKYIRTLLPGQSGGPTHD